MTTIRHGDMSGLLYALADTRDIGWEITTNNYDVGIQAHARVETRAVTFFWEPRENSGTDHEAWFQKFYADEDGDVEESDRVDFDSKDARELAMQAVAWLRGGQAPTGVFADDDASAVAQGPVEPKTPYDIEF